MAEKHKLMTFEEWQNAIKNPPKSWTDYNMDWNDPNPQDSIYWMAIAEAIKQRWYVAKYLGSSRSSLPDLNYVISFKYEMAITTGFLLYIRNCIVQLAKLYVDTEVQDYSFLFIKETHDEFNTDHLFPAMLSDYKIYKKCPNMANILNYKETDIQRTKILMKQFKTALNMMKQTPNGAIWGRRIGYDVNYVVDRYDPWDKMEGAFQDGEDNYKTYRGSYYTGVQEYGYNNQMGYSCFGDEYCFVGVTAYEYRRDKYNDEVYLSYWYSGHLKFINDFATWNPLGIKSKLKIYRYVSTNIDIPDQIREDEEYYEGEYYEAGWKYSYEPYNFGYPQGFSIEDKGEAPTTPTQLDFVTVKDLPIFGTSEIPAGDYGPSTYYPENPFIHTLKIKGCKFLAVPIIDYGCEGGFKFQ